MPLNSSAAQLWQNINKWKSEIGRAEKINVIFFKKSF